MRFYKIILSQMIFGMNSNFFNVCGHIVHGHVPPSVSHLFATSQLLALQKQMDNIRPIMIGKVTYWLITLTLAIQFRDTFAEHFNPH
jgi:hypothetical protein